MSDLLLRPPAPALADGERAELDAYWTPLACARACCAVLRPRVGATRILEPAVGGGAWVQAARETWPGATVDAIDLDASAPGLAAADAHVIGDFLSTTGRGYGLVLGNPPYGGDLVGWVERARDAGAAVAFLLRSTFLGSVSRSSFWLQHQPTDVWVLAPRPRWEGPGSRPTTDTADSILVLWRQGLPVPGLSPRLHWLRWAP